MLLITLYVISLRHSFVTESWCGESGMGKIACTETWNVFWKLIYFFSLFCKRTKTYTTSSEYSKSHSCFLDLINFSFVQTISIVVTCNVNDWQEGVVVSMVDSFAQFRWVREGGGCETHVKTDVQKAVVIIERTPDTLGSHASDISQAS